jgi:radical SAM protein with 4Fe4S-binding SPASM domain
VTPEREEMLKRHNVVISYSLDGPPHVNDELRGGSRKIMENWRRMRANGTEAGTICLIQPSNWDRMDEVLRFFHEEGIHNVRFNLMVPDGRGKEVDTATTDKLFGAKKTILDYMLETEGQSVVDATLYNAMKRFVKGNGAPSSFEYHGCESLYCQAGRSLYSVNPDGRFYACDRIAENPLWAMGNVNQDFTPPHEEAAIKKRHEFHHKDEWWSRCEGCNAKKICEFSCSAYYVDKVDTREIECQYTKRMWEYFLDRKDEIVLFMKKNLSIIYIDEKRPLLEQSEETWVVRDIATDAFYNQLSLVDTLAANKHYQLFQRGEQYYLFVHRRQKIFEIDELVAEIARFNGVLAPQFVEGALTSRFPKGKLRETIASIESKIPEVFYQMTGENQRDLVRHAGHLEDDETFWGRFFRRSREARVRA